MSGHTGGGIALVGGSQVNRYQFAGNTSSGNAVGVNLLANAGANRNEFTDTVARDNRIAGFQILSGSAQNEVVRSLLLGNATDAVELNVLEDGSLANSWIDTTCETDRPTGAIC